jgi:TPP-dependent pyruvate/acetoin dehydrogenase alpha subunit
MIHPEDEARIEAEVADEIAVAVAFAEAGTWEPVEDLTRFVLAESAGSADERNAATPSRI